VDARWAIIMRIAGASYQPPQPRCPLAAASSTGSLRVAQQLTSSDGARGWLAAARVAAGRILHNYKKTYNTCTECKHI
jgi:hypothetical protein